jgi:hypothetical protein
LAKTAIILSVCLSHEDCGEFTSEEDTDTARILDSGASLHTDATLILAHGDLGSVQKKFGDPRRLSIREFIAETLR